MQISDQEREIVLGILQRYVPTHTVWAFGSRVKGTAKPYSDLDLAIMGEQPLSLTTHADLVEAFSQSDLVWKVDLVDWATTSETFRQIISEKYEIVQSGTI